MSSLVRRLAGRIRHRLRPPPIIDSVDNAPWDHPFLTSENLRRFRDYCGAVWDFAVDYHTKYPRPLNLAFCVNIAQSAYKWAALSIEYGVPATLYLHPLDNNALSTPEWEDFDGEFPNVHEGAAFLEAAREVKPRCPVVRTPLGGEELYNALRKAKTGNRKPLFELVGYPSAIRYEPFLTHSGTAPTLPMVQALTKHDAVMAPSIPIPAYLSGRPYLAQSIGGDLQFDCGKGDEFGQLIALSFAAARFLNFTNPHVIGMCRRLGMTNGLYLPYPMDDERYCPGPGHARKEWVAEHGEGTYVLSTARIDNSVKGNGTAILGALVEAAKKCPSLRYVFLAWGHGADQFREEVNATGVGHQFVFRKPVGKTRLIDYLRSCDAVLDQFVYGYYGATGLEAAGVGKPILMRILAEQYSPLYRCDVAPVINLSGPDQLASALVKLVEQPDWHRQRGEELRAWLVRNHGAKRTMPILLALMRLAADNVPLPADLVNPLRDVESQAEREYHKACLKARVEG